LSATENKLLAPFPWFGGKSRVANVVWERFGDVANYVEPFAGSLAVLLMRPHAPKTETINDKDCYLANFWRALKTQPVELAAFADWPVNEADLLARHRWIVQQREFVEKMRTDPFYFDARIAGWWVWGLCAWIGSGWCRQRGNRDQPEQLPHLGDAGMGINRKLPHLGDAGRGERIQEYFERLSERLRDVRICCGDWKRTLGDSVTFNHGVTGIFLDPPYSSDEHTVEYSADSDVSEAVWQWANENGSNKLLRIALCGYEGEHAMMPEDWECVPWKTRGGYGSQSNGQGRENAARERIWFSPHCLGGNQKTLF
jgi:site-specific DNA-adenine methylase